MTSIITNEIEERYPYPDNGERPTGITSLGQCLASRKAYMAGVCRKITDREIAAAALAALGSAYLFFKEASTLMKAAALLGILSAPVLAMMPQIPRWGGFGAALSVLPVLFFCLWLVVFYKENAANPILWSYGMEILAIAMCLLAVFRLSAYLFYRAKPRRAIFACMLALITSLATLTDSVSLGARAVLGGWGIGTAVMCWIIINNFVPPAPEEDTY